MSFKGELFLLVYLTDLCVLINLIGRFRLQSIPSQRLSHFEKLSFHLQLPSNRSLVTLLELCFFLSSGSYGKELQLRVGRQGKEDQRNQGFNRCEKSADCSVIDSFSRAEYWSSSLFHSLSDGKEWVDSVEVRGVLSEVEIQEDSFFPSLFFFHSLVKLAVSHSLSRLDRSILTVESAVRSLPSSPLPSDCSFSDSLAVIRSPQASSSSQRHPSRLPVISQSL